MKTIGLLGGMSWESTRHYYELVNEGVKRRLGGLHSARVIVYSLDFAPIAAMQAEGRWAEAGDLLAGAAAALARAGADFLLLCTNTMHVVADRITALPLLHIADPTAEAIRRRGLARVGLLGTSFTMEQPFYRERLAAGGLEALVPGAGDRALVHRVIYEELCLGRVEPASRAAYRRIADDLVAGGAQGIILGCTEIGMLLGAGDACVPVFDTTVLHAEAAVELALGG